MNRFFKGQRGFNLIELAVVLAIMGLLAAIVTPNVTGFLGKGAKESYEGDKKALQTAGDSFRTDSSNIGGKYPTLANFAGGDASTPATVDTDDADNCASDGGKGIGTPGTGCNSYINIAALVSGATITGGSIPGGFLKSTDAVRSADTSKNTTATNTPSGTYGWYVDANGQVLSTPTYDEAQTYP
ncbi:MAG: prepilin-type N-terminal cleavage/methylation domain-containing protein [Chloroflexi bacterium]|nr:prepilin-type N-terminal cleavage/methylation domain-containing protein [Chloroflexota bacterium]